MTFAFRSERSQDSLTITSKPFERMFCVVAMQKSKSKTFEFKKMTYQDEILTDESKAEVTCHEIPFIHYISIYIFIYFRFCPKIKIWKPYNKDDGMTDGMTEAMMEEMMELNDDDFI